MCIIGVSLLVRGCLSGATPRGQPWMSAVLLPHGHNELNARRMAVLETFRAPSLCRHVHRELLRSVWLDLPSIIAATTCHQRNYAERYSRYSDKGCQLVGYVGWDRIHLSPIQALAAWS